MKKSVLLVLLVSLVLSTVSSAAVLREIWWGGASIDEAIALVNSGTPADQIDVLENPTWVDIADNYVAKMSGWLTIPATGEYTFYISGDDYQRLYVSQDDNPANAEMVAFVDGWTASQEWTKYASQKAAPMMLEEGQVLAIVGIMQEGGGGDGQDWGWTGPGVEAITLIPGDLFVTEYEVTAPIKAKVISPANGATGVITAVASWYMPDEDAEDAIYDLYFGTDPGDLALVAEGIVEAEAFVGTAGIDLDFGTTYYWRVDVPGGQGFVWSFTTEPMTFAVQNVVATSNGTPQEGSGPEKAVNGVISNEATDQWLAAPPEGEALYIQFELPRVYKLYDMAIFNSNTQFEALLGYGAKDVTIEYSADGDDWMVFGDVELAQAAETVIDMAGIGAKFVRLTINTTWGGLFPDSGLTNVAMTYVPAHARFPSPSNGATGVDPASVLSWQAGRNAVSSDVTVNGEVTTVEGSSFAADLIYGMPYAWQVDEFDGVDVWAGDAWSFTTAEFVPVAAATLVYDEDGNAMEVDMDGADLTAYAPDTLRVAFSGNPVGFAEADGVITIGGAGADIWGTADQFRYVYKTLAGDGTIVARVDSMTNITNEWAKAGVMVRQSTAAGSAHSMTVITAGGGNGASFQGRVSANIDSVNNDATSAVTSPYYVKVERVGNDISGFISADGEEWLQLGGAREVVMEDPVLIGLAVTSHTSGSPLVAQFSEVATTGDVEGEWTAEAIGVAMPANDAAGLYVAVEDAAGQVAVVAHPDEAATQLVSTQNWNIPLAGLAGVDLANVAKIVVGAGTPDAPATGSGTVSVTISVGTPMSHNVLADVTSPADEIVGVPNDGDWPGAETPNLAFDNDVATKYLHFKGETEPTGVQITPAVGPTVVTGIALTTANDAVERDPVSFELYGSNDGIDGPYTLIASGDVVDFAGETAWPRFTKNVTPITFDNDVAYTSYQILFPAVRDPGSANSMQIAEIELIGVSSW
ncbi:discoidin domain-containing protein [Anaerobaca lacustris]|uniref:Discoidin domain-containing protein n=1 Tax=Anaerobaca lacustris TaxID=3044600 RepID=A0AAW6TZG6_9BACT|nr:discoidin domain-containing protein [Sedimentisphaerales bacterium M17dextr]